MANVSQDEKLEVAVKTLKQIEHLTEPPTKGIAQEALKKIGEVAGDEESPLKEENERMEQSYRDNSEKGIDREVGGNFEIGDKVRVTKTVDQPDGNLATYVKGEKGEVVDLGGPIGQSGAVRVKLDGNEDAWEEAYPNCTDMHITNEHYEYVSIELIEKID